MHSQRENREDPIPRGTDSKKKDTLKQVSNRRGKEKKPKKTGIWGNNAGREG